MSRSCFCLFSISWTPSFGPSAGSLQDIRVNHGPHRRTRQDFNGRQVLEIHTTGTQLGGPLSGMTDRTTDHWLGRHYAADHVHGPVAFLNPTTRLQALDRPKSHPSQGDVQAGGAETPSSGSPPPSRTGVYSVWRSRDNRKGRHALHLTPSRVEAIGASYKHTNTLSAALAGIGRMLMRWPVWDVSYDVAMVFTLGSVGSSSIRLPASSIPLSYCNIALVKSHH